MNRLPLSLLPLALEHHRAALQGVYDATPDYWARYHWPSAPPNQAEHDLTEAAATPGRTLLGIARRLDANDPKMGAELVGVIDFRLHWPGQQVASIGLFMVAQPVQRQGIGTQAWQLLVPWLMNTAGMHKARLGVEQFNPGALQFFLHLGFQLTGQTDRHRVGDKFVRLLYMEQEWPQPLANSTQPTGVNGGGAATTA